MPKRRISPRRRSPTKARSPKKSKQPSLELETAEAEEELKQEVEKIQVPVEVEQEEGEASVQPEEYVPVENENLKEPETEKEEIEASASARLSEQLPIQRVEQSPSPVRKTQEPVPRDYQPYDQVNSSLNKKSLLFFLSSEYNMSFVLEQYFILVKVYLQIFRC